MKYFAYKQSSISDFYHIFDTPKSQITYDSLVTSTDEYKNKLLCQNNIFFILGSDRIIRDVWIIITHGGF